MPSPMSLLAWRDACPVLPQSDCAKPRPPGAAPSRRAGHRSIDFEPANYFARLRESSHGRRSARQDASIGV